MGTLLGGECPGCGYTAELAVGSGLRDCMPDAALLAGNQDAALAADLKKGCSFQIERVPAVCAACQELHVGTKVVWFPEKGEPRTLFSPCPDCGKTMLWYPGDARVVSCPVCKQAIHLAPVGYWD